MSRRKERIRGHTPVNIEKIKIDKYLSFLLPLYGLKRKRDYVVRPSHLYITKNVINRKILRNLKENYPQFNYYWDTPRVLIWF